MGEQRTASPFGYPQGLRLAGRSPDFFASAVERALVERALVERAVGDLGALTEGATSAPHLARLIAYR